MKRQETLDRSMARAAETESGAILKEMTARSMKFLHETSLYNTMLARARADKAHAMQKLASVEKDTAYFGGEIRKLGETAAKENWDRKRLDEATRELQARFLRETGSIVTMSQMHEYVKAIREGKDTRGFHSVDVKFEAGGRKSEVEGLKGKLSEDVNTYDAMEKKALQKLDESMAGMKAASDDFRKRGEDIMKRYGVPLLPGEEGFAKEKPAGPVAITPAVREALWAARHARSLPLVEQRMRKLREKAKGIRPLVRIYEENAAAAEENRRNAKKLEERELANLFTFLQKQGLLKKGERRDITWQAAREMLRNAKAPKAKIEEYEKVLPLVSKYAQLMGNARSASAIAEAHAPHYNRLGGIKAELEYLRGIWNQVAEAKRLRETATGVARFTIKRRKR